MLLLISAVCRTESQESSCSSPLTIPFPVLFGNELLFMPPIPTNWACCLQLTDWCWGAQSLRSCCGSHHAGANNCIPWTAFAAIRRKLELCFLRSCTAEPSRVLKRIRGSYFMHVLASPSLHLPACLDSSHQKSRFHVIFFTAPFAACIKKELPFLTHNLFSYQV